MMRLLLHRTATRMFAMNLALPAIAVMLTAGCGTTAQQRAQGLVATGTGDDVLFQHAVFNSLMQGNYDGTLPVTEALKHGDIGLGTFDKLDGEMLVLDGNCYQIRSDGTVREAPPGMTTPFCAVTPFKKDLVLMVPRSVSLDELKTTIDKILPGQNLFYAIRITGKFSGVKARSVPAQEPPYEPLAAVVARQSVFDIPAGDGTIVGFRCPPYTGMVGVPGYHFHYINESRSAGGHLMSCVLESGRVEVDTTTGFTLSLPNNPSFLNADLTRTTPAEREAVERPSGSDVPR